MPLFRRLLVPVDFSPYSQEALDHAVFLAKRLDGELYLLHVFEPPFYPPAGRSLDVPSEVYQWIRGLKEDASKKLSDLAAVVAHQGVRIQPFLKEGVPFMVILEMAAEVDADLIVMGTHGRTGLARVMLGSVAERIVRKSPCPVYTVRPKETGAAQEGEIPKEEVP